MPRFDLVSLGEAQIKAARGKRAELIREYVNYVEQLGRGQAGRLQPTGGESVAAVRRRLGSAAKVAGKDLVIRRAGEEVYFWTREERPARGRRRRAANGG